ncbi:patatin-like phospholipase domain-containing protein 2 isoform X2 [Mugil cephalus]|uniref:patatin-like phospholipase domain-containing protein 2 isoform X2 n=1 Tax=Mugil cephalus TaxID=48193 RepID=UPI001FB7AF0C|nr:patatin-like phospholipase domain-containing protein 2 isoform X2 [Mugil cephalus]
MGTSEKMVPGAEEWNLSFAGCGFRSVYYVGALSCILERVPWLVHGASKICGASSGCLVAAALCVGIPIELCVDVLTTAKEARKHTLGVFHPTFSLLRTVRDSLLVKLPEDAHLRASGKLCVSLTRLVDGENVLVSEFDSREELIQVLMCSCFFPVYCGFIPPSYRGVFYMDGALSNNMPLFEQRNTITMAPFSGETDICPREGTFNFFDVHYGNVSIQVNTGNVHRVCTSFLPPPLEKLAEICHNGYMDALRFLKERDWGAQCIPHRVVVEAGGAKPPCCELVKELCQLEDCGTKKRMLNGHVPHQEDHLWLDHRVIENLPVAIKRVLCEACRDSRDGGSWSAWCTDFLLVKAVMYLLTLLILPVEATFSLTKSVILSGSAAVCRLLASSENFCKQTGNIEGDNHSSRVSREQICSVTSSGSRRRDHSAGDREIPTLASRRILSFNKHLHWDSNSNLDLLCFISTDTDSPARGKVTLNTEVNDDTINCERDRRKTI